MKKNESQPGSGVLPSSETVGAADYSPRKMTLIENLVLTAKILSGFGVLGVLIWGVGLWTGAK